MEVSFALYSGESSVGTGQLLIKKDRDGVYSGRIMSILFEDKDDKDKGGHGSTRISSSSTGSDSEDNCKNENENGENEGENEVKGENENGEVKGENENGEVKGENEVKGDQTEKFTNNEHVSFDKNSSLFSCLKRALLKRCDNENCIEKHPSLCCPPFLASSSDFNDNDGLQKNPFKDENFRTLISSLKTFMVVEPSCSKVSSFSSKIENDDDDSSIQELISKLLSNDDDDSEEDSLYEAIGGDDINQHSPLEELSVSDYSEDALEEEESDFEDLSSWSDTDDDLDTNDDSDESATENVQEMKTLVNLQQQDFSTFDDVFKKIIEATGSSKIQTYRVFSSQQGPMDKKKVGHDYQSLCFLFGKMSRKAYPNLDHSLIFCRNGKMYRLSPKSISLSDKSNQNPDNRIKLAHNPFDVTGKDLVVVKICQLGNLKSERLLERRRARSLRQSYWTERVILKKLGRLIDSFESNGKGYLIMPLVRAKPLSSFRFSQRNFSSSQLHLLKEKTVSVVKKFHEITGFAHRDLHFDNILWSGSPSDDPIIIDFGLARRAFDQSDLDMDIRMISFTFDRMLYEISKGKGTIVNPMALKD